MRHCIMVFNTRSIEQISKAMIMEALTGSNLYTLCNQYKLSPVMIDPALRNLAIVLTQKQIAPFFLLRYRPEGQRPLVVNRWDKTDSAGKSFLQEGLVKVSSQLVKAHLVETDQVFVIELDYSQIKDMGLVFAYEIARWAAYQGQGIVRGLDNQWYKLNCNKAFIPLEPHYD